MKWPEAGEGLHRVNVGRDEEYHSIQSLVNEIPARARDGRPYGDDLCLNLLEQMLIRISRAASPVPAAQLDSRVQNACDYLRTRLAEMITVEEVARHCNISPSRLSHVFKKEMGVGLQQYRNRLRMQAARKLLVTTRLPVADIAMRSGYIDPT